MNAAALPSRAAVSGAVLAAALLVQPLQAAWTRTDWNGEPAWVAQRGPVCAIVSAARARLVYLGAADGTRNLLHASAGAPTAGADADWGGHRFWLGPQYRWKWPPPVEWEHSAAESVEARGEVLVVVLPRRDPAYPALTREYAWDEARLRCTVRWADDGRPYFGLHVIAVDVPFALTARLVKWEEVPEGFVAARMIAPPEPVRLPHPALAVAGDRLTLQSGRATVKLGFAPQPLAIARPQGWTLTVYPGPNDGVPVGVADQGYLSQAWAGGPKNVVAELEQLSPYLLGDAAHRCASTIYLAAAPPAK